MAVDSIPKPALRAVLVAYDVQVFFQIALNKRGSITTKESVSMNL